jgi:hypothetical protein
LYKIKPLDNAGYQLENLPVEAYMPPSHKRKGLEKSVQDFIPGATRDVFYMLFQNGITEVNSLTGNVQFLSRTP